MRLSALLVTLLVLLALGGNWYWGYRRQAEDLRLPAGRIDEGALDVPVLRSPQALPPSALAEFALWGMQAPAETKPAAPVGDEKFPVYAVKKFEGVPAACRVGREDYRWEFYGVTARAGGARAVFRNPARGEAGWRLAGEGETLEENLALRRIAGNTVLLFNKLGADSGAELELTVFGVNLEQVFKSRRTRPESPPAGK